MWPARTMTEPSALPLEAVMARAAAYRDCRNATSDPLALSVLSLFGMMHRLHLDELLRFAAPDALEMPGLPLEVRRLTGALGRGGPGWMQRFVAAEIALQDRYRACLATAPAKLRTLLLRQETVLRDRLADVLAESGRRSAGPDADEPIAFHPSLKGPQP